MQPKTSSEAPVDVADYLPGETWTLALGPQEIVRRDSLSSCFWQAAVMAALEAAMVKVERDIGQVEADAKMALAQGRAEEAFWLRKKEEQLHTNLKQLREKELIAVRASGKQYHSKIYLQRSVLYAKIQMQGHSHFTCLLRPFNTFGCCNASKAQPG